MKCLVWGTGTFAEIFCNVMQSYVEIKAFVETLPQIKVFKRRPVYSPEEIMEFEYDYILVVNTHFEEIRRLCIEKNIVSVEKLVNIFESKMKVVEKEDTFEICLFKKGERDSNWLLWKENLLCTDNDKLFKELTDNKVNSDWWREINNNVIFSASTQLEENTKKILTEWICSKASKNDLVLDIGCSNGVVDEIIAPYVKCVHAYDYSEDSINCAKNRAEFLGIKNIDYKVADAKEVVFDSRYNIVLMLGLTVYFECDEDVKETIRKVYNALEDDGIVLVKDSVNIVSDKNVYHCNYNNGYQACYRAKDFYEKLWVVAGFEIVKETIIADDLNIGSMYKYSMGYLLRKKI